MQEQLLEETKKELYQDFEELLFLYSSSLKKLQTFQKEIEKQKNNILSFAMLFQTAKEYEKRYTKTIAEIKKKQQALRNTYVKKEETLLLLSHQKQTYYDTYRSLQSMLAGLTTSSDWQSPSFRHSIYSLAGRQSGSITAYTSDYKRDYHLDTRVYEQAFLQEYISSSFKSPLHVYLTNSGMSALTTILSYLQMEQEITRPILLGTSSYFQNKELIKKIFGKQVIEVSEHETETINKLIKQKNPQVLFFDSLCNSSDIAIPHLKEMVKTLKRVKQHVFLIIDNTCLAASFQPLQLIGILPEHITIIVFESMNKYYQFGMDRTTSGVIYTKWHNTGKLFEIRKHIGSIISDTSCFMLPSPNKNILRNRLSRHEKNTSLLVFALDTYVQNESSPLQAIVSPLLPSHKAYSWAKSLSFHGSFFTFAWKKKYDTIRSYQKFIALVLKEAQKRKINIVEGTSFGMNTSRIYLTAKDTKFGKPFVRFSVGCETRGEIEIIKEVLVHALKRL